MVKLEKGDKILITKYIENNSDIDDICTIEHVYLDSYSKEYWCNYINQKGNTGGFEIKYYQNHFKLLSKEAEIKIW